MSGKPEKEPSIHIFPQKRTIGAHSGELLIETLIRHSIFLRSDCGGKGMCHKCRVNLISENGSQEPIDACCRKVESDIKIIIPDSSMAPSHIMDKAPLFFPETFTEKFNPEALSEDYGIAVDIGTTTIAIYLCNMENGRVIASTAIKNSQAIYGDDVIGRITSILEKSDNLARLNDLVIRSIEWGIDNLFSSIDSSGKKLSGMVVVGNPTMIHIFTKTDPSSIGIAPFLPAFYNSKQFFSDELGFNLSRIPIRTLPNVSGFIGGDILAASVAVDIEKQPSGTLLIDLGTNGELMLKSGKKLYATSCAIGPAFEGATLSCGMQGIPGAINAVKIGPDQSVNAISVINPSQKKGLKPDGICGTGVLNAISQFHKNGIIRPDGAFSDGADRFVLLPHSTEKNQPEIYISQKDIRSVQLGKSALKSGIEFLLKKAGIKKPQKIIIAGAMGAHVNTEDLISLGMIPPISPDRIKIAGNLAGSGAVMALCDVSYIEKAIHLAEKSEILELAASIEFQNSFIENLSFPEKSDQNS